MTYTNYGFADGDVWNAAAVEALEDHLAAYVDRAESVVVVTGTNDSAAIQAAFDALVDDNGHAVGTLRVVGHIADIDTALDFDLGYSNVAADANYSAGNGEGFRLVCDAALRPDASLAQALKVYGGYGARIQARFDAGGDRRTVSDAAMTSGDATLTSSTAAFTAADVGRVVTVAGAGNAGGTLQATITSRNSSTSVELSDTAKDDVSSADLAIRTVALHVENLLNAEIDVYAGAYEGTVLHADATGDTTKRIRMSRVESLVAQQCGQAIFFKSIEAFGPFNYVWDEESVDGSYFGQCDDIGIGHYEGGQFDETSATITLDFDACNSMNAQTISVGGDSTECLFQIRGNPNDEASDFGTISELRVSASQSLTSPVGVRIKDVSSVMIGQLVTFRNVVGLHIIGSTTSGAMGNIRIGKHESRTGETNALKISPGVGTTPCVDINVHYRLNRLGSIVVESGLTGGQLTLDGLIDTPNSTSSQTPEPSVIDCASDDFIINVASTFWQKLRNASFIDLGLKHTDPTSIHNAANARIDNGVST